MERVITTTIMVCKPDELCIRTENDRLQAMQRVIITMLDIVAPKTSTLARENTEEEEESITTPIMVCTFGELGLV